MLTDLADPLELAAELGASSCAHDVTSEADWARVMAMLQAEQGGLDVLVNNAGRFLMRPVSETTLEDWRALQAVNVEGVFLGCKLALPLLAARAGRRRGGASIINLSSVAGLTGAAGAVAYNASKGAVRLMTKGMALEFAPMKIRVNSVHPGVIDTDMGRDLLDRVAALTGEGENAVRAQVTLAHPPGRLGEARDVAVAFLASDQAAFITGSELVVDGGFTAR
jgi:NAD(P)-dependent dehydrogenase (short-subunit alcohol dehydrogenase family)